MLSTLAFLSFLPLVFTLMTVFCVAILVEQENGVSSVGVRAFSLHPHKDLHNFSCYQISNNRQTELLGKFRDKETTIKSTGRRAIIAQVAKEWIRISSTTSILFHARMHDRAAAACLSGDTSPDCVGVYKVPLDDATLPYLGTPENAAKFAPDLRFVPPVKEPSSYLDAVQEFRSLGASLHDVIKKITQGQLEVGGQLLLGIIPRATVCSRVILRATERRLDMESAAALRLEAFLPEFIVTISQCDIMIGQALRGELGSITFAQLQILDALKESLNDYNEIVKAFDML